MAVVGATSPSAFGAAKEQKPADRAVRQRRLNN
jgi:hypothetical protein